MKYPEKESTHFTVNMSAILNEKQLTFIVFDLNKTTQINKVELKLEMIDRYGGKIIATKYLPLTTLIKKMMGNSFVDEMDAQFDSWELAKVLK